MSVGESLQADFYSVPAENFRALVSSSDQDFTIQRPELLLDWGRRMTACPLSNRCRRGWLDLETTGGDYLSL